MEVTNLKIVLLPGMDGTGDLFKYLLSHLEPYDTQVIPLPQSGSQDYTTLINYLKTRLPNEDYILIAESFSGALATKLINEDIHQPKKIIFVATFLTPPNPILLSIAKKLPLKTLAKLPLSQYFQKQLFIGESAEQDLVELFQDILNKISAEVLSDRIKSMQSLSINNPTRDIPCLYIQASSDRLVSSNKYNEFKKYFSNIELIQFEGPHFILQTKPKECADVIAEFIST